jgi:glycosyltransferase involved in cell wall biosynthesis
MGKVKIHLESPVRTKGDIAIILTSYGRDVYLQRAINSVLAQTYSNFVLVIIDDNSVNTNPKTQQIIRGFGDERIMYFRTDTSPTERASISTFCRNLNFMLRYINDQLTVKYVCYLPCDDWYYPNRIKHAIKYLHRTSSRSCWSPVDLVDKRGRKIGEIPTKNQIPGNGKIQNPISVLDHSCVTHRISVLASMNYPWWPLNKQTEHRAPDGEFFTRLTASHGPIELCHTHALGAKTRHGASIQGRIHGWK